MSCYIDPGTGSLALQLLLTGGLLVACAVRKYWRQCKHYAKRAYDYAKSLFVS